MDDIIDLSVESDDEPPAKKQQLLQLSLTPPDVVDVSDDEQVEQTQRSPKPETPNSVSDKSVLQIKSKIDGMMGKQTEVKTDNISRLPFKIKVHKELQPIKLASESNIKENSADSHTTDVMDESNNLLQVLREEPVGADIVPHNTNEKLGSASEASTSYSCRATTSSFTLPNELNTFLDQCLDNLKHKTIDRKVSSVRIAAFQASEYVQTQEFRDTLASFQETAYRDPSTMAASFVKLYRLFKANGNPPDEDGRVIDAKTAWRMVRLNDLYDKLEQVQAKIAHYSSADVDFDKEENSTYMKYAKYMGKAKEILDAIAKLQGHSPYSGLQYFSRLDFAGSKHQAFNVALNRKYHNCEKDAFPVFYDVNKLLRKCAKKNDLDVGEADLRTEIETCFKSLGKLIKKRRQKDLECVHSAYLKDHRDPARDDPELERRLKENHKMCKRIDDVLSKYSDMQDIGVEPELSPDSEDSARQSDEDESDDDDNISGLPFKIEVHKELQPIKLASESNIKENSADPHTTDVTDESNNLLQVLREEPVEADIVPHNTNNKKLLSVSEASTSYSCRATTSCPTASSTLPDELNTFLIECLDNLRHKTIHKKVRSVRTAARQASEYVQTQEFRDALASFQETAYRDPSTMAASFVKLYNLLIAHPDPPDEHGHVLDAKTARRMEQLNDLYDKLEQVQAKIAHYSSADVDFDEEENSTYMKYTKYLSKAKEILDAIAKLQGHSPHSGLQYFNRLDFAGSKHQAFNVALNRKYKNREEDAFPVFYDVNKLLRKCAKKNDLDVGEADLRTEIETCFTSLGKLIKKRRQKDLECVHSAYLKDHRDPARDDPELERRLKENHKMRKRIDDVLSKYSDMQDIGVEPELSPDSEDSARQSDEDESDDDDDALCP